ncbi:Chymotrypsinogen 2 [Frankliniella fusca]|uniref:Chymotrypsinogen 2 n=1 Tax=Frankliniella fusca TaxID=407009 RepID=A0AAE1HCG2_9NEOP|nr:Chymotrypsinogen 2 [Frankliniella fusca]
MNVLGVAVCLLATAVAVGGSPVEKPPQGRLRIFHGKDAVKGQVPYQVALLADSKFFCSGTLISWAAVLTTANCLDWVRGDVEVRAGIYKLDETGKDVQTTITKMEDRVIHPRFDLEYLDNDIAIINNVKIQFVTNLVEWVTLPSYADAGADLAGSTVTVTGWGSVSDDDTPNNVLQVAEIRLDNLSECLADYGNQVIGTKLCATTGMALSMANTCTGDAGGPAVTFFQRQYFLVGLVSHGSQQACTEGKPVVYTRVSSFLDFIAENAKNVKIVD